MFGVAANVIAILVGAAFGLLFKRFISEATGQRIELAIGYCVLVIGMRMALKYENVLILVGCVIAGGVIGKALELEMRTEALSLWVQKKFAGKGAEGDNRFAKGFAVSSVLFCTGAMAVVGSIQSGVQGDHDTLIAKSMLDGSINISFAAVYGAGVALSAVPVLLYQGGIALLAGNLSALTDPQVLNEISGVGGVLIMMIGATLAGIRKVSVVEFLPAVIIVCVVAALVY